MSTMSPGAQSEKAFAERRGRRASENVSSGPVIREVHHARGARAFLIGLNNHGSVDDVTPPLLVPCHHHRCFLLVSAQGAAVMKNLQIIRVDDIAGSSCWTLVEDVLHPPHRSLPS